jgi:hypothetical protein
VESSLSSASIAGVSLETGEDKDAAGGAAREFVCCAQAPSTSQAMTMIADAARQTGIAPPSSLVRGNAIAYFERDIRRSLASAPQRYGHRSCHDSGEIGADARNLQGKIDDRVQAGED